MNENAEAPLDPERPIIDPHLHLWDIPASPGALQEPQTFLVRDAADLIAASGHRITHTVFVECHAMYRADGPEALKSLGETTFAAGMAAMAESGLYGPSRIAHRIVANIDLQLGEALAGVLDQHRAVAGDRLRGVRMNTAFSPAGLFGWPAEPAAETRLADPRFIAGLRTLTARGFSLDVWCLHPQLLQLTALARAVPDALIVLNHLGTPDVRGARADEAFAEWRRALADLAACPNVRIKISGLSMDINGPLRATTGTAPSDALAEDWRPRFETAIEAFGPARCMFASNYPADRAAASYGAIWNAFKRLAADFSETEKDRLFRDTAAETYQIDLAA